MTSIRIFVILILHSFGQTIICQDTNQISLDRIPDSTLYYKLIEINASGFDPGEKAIIKLTAIDAEGNTWNSNATFISNESGEINPGKTESIEGSYVGLYPMGLFWSMKSKDDHQIATGKGYTATIEVVHEGKSKAKQMFYRTAPENWTSWE